MKKQLEWHRMRDQEHPRNVLYSSLLDFDGCQIGKKTYFVKFLLFIISLVVTSVFYYSISIQQTDLNRLHLPNDFRADLCGFKQLSDKPFIFYRDSVNLGIIGFCVDKCPEQDQASLCYYYNDGQRILEDWCYPTYKSTNIGRVCVPSDYNNANYQPILDHITSNRQWIRQIAASLQFNFNRLVLTVIIINVIGLFTNLTNLIQHQKMAVILTYIYYGLANIFIIVILSLIGTEKNTLQNHFCSIANDNCINNIHYYYDLALTFLSLVLIAYFAYGIINYQNIKVESKCRVIIYPLKVKTLFFSFIIQILSNLLIITMLYLWVINIAVGKVETVNANQYFENDIYRDVLYNTHDNLLYIFLLVISVIFLNYLKIVTRMIVSGQISVYFSTFSKFYLNKPLLRPLYNTIIKCSGQIIFGIFLQIIFYHIKIVSQVIKVIFDKLDQKDKENKVIDALFYFFYPFTRFYEDQLKFLNNDNYYNMAIFGESYYLSGEKIYYLKNRNLPRLKRLLPTINIQKNIMRVFLASLSGIIFSMQIKQTSTQIDNYFVNEQVYNQVYNNNFDYILLLIVVIVNYYGQWIFCSILDETKETIYLIYCMDEEMFQGNQRRGVSFKPFFDGFGEETVKIKQGILKINEIEVIEENNLFQQVEEVLKMDPVIDTKFHNIFDQNTGPTEIITQPEQKRRKKEIQHKYNQQNIFDKMKNEDEEKEVIKKVVKKENMAQFNQNNIFDKIDEEGPTESENKNVRKKKKVQITQNFNNTNIFSKQNDQLEEELSQFDKSSYTSQVSRRVHQKQNQYIVKTSVFEQQLNEEDEDEFLDLDEKQRRLETLENYDTVNLFDKQSMAESNNYDVQSKITRKNVKLEHFESADLFQKTKLDSIIDDESVSKQVKRNQQSLEQFDNPNLFEKTSLVDNDRIDNHNDKRIIRKQEVKEQFQSKGIFDNDQISLSQQQNNQEQIQQRSKKVEQLEEIKIEGIFEKEQEDFLDISESSEGKIQRKQEKLEAIKVDGIFEKQQNFIDQSDESDDKIQRKQEKLEEIKVEGIFEKQQDDYLDISQDSDNKIQRKQEKLETIKVDGIFEKQQNFDDYSDQSEQIIKRKQEKLETIKVEGIFEKEQNFLDDSDESNDIIQRKQERLQNYNQQNIFDKDNEEEEQEQIQNRHRQQPQLQQYDAPSIFDKDLVQNKQENQQNRKKKIVQQQQYQQPSIFGSKLDDIIDY